MTGSPLPTLALSTPARRATRWEARLLVLGSLAAAVGCAKVSTQNPRDGGGTGGSPVVMIMGLASIRVNPMEQTITLGGTTAATLSGTATFTAEGTFADMHTEDVTSKVFWQSNIPTAIASGGTVQVSAPGRYTITARNGSVSASASLIAQYVGTFFGNGFPASDAPKLDANPTGQVTIAYPLNGAIFPANVGAVTVHLPKSGSQDVARLALGGDGLDVKYYARCETGLGTGCYVTLPAELTRLLIAPSTMNDVRLTARLGSSAGGAVAESTPINLAWANVNLQGGLYYWTTIKSDASIPGYMSPNMKPNGGGRDDGTGVMRYDFDGDTPRREVVYTDRGMVRDVDNNPATPLAIPVPPLESPPAAPNEPMWGEGRCIGCHSISFDGKLMAFSIGGSAPSNFALLNLETRMLTELDPNAAPGVPPTDVLNYLKRFRKANFAAFTTFGPKNDLMVNMYRGALTLTRVDATLMPVRANLFQTATSELKTDPFWSPDGMHFAFTSYDPAASTDTANRANGDLKVGGRIWVATADETGPRDDARELIPREPGMTSYYPTISADGVLLAFNKASCSGLMNPGGYGTGPCDGYDDISASLWLTSPAGRTPVKLVQANGGDGNGNSWPRWSPNSGDFRGQKLYWLAFSSRRNYGLQINTAGPMAAVPQLWFAAVVVASGEFGGVGDPSYPPVWLPNQNLEPSLPAGNHVPQWVKVAIPID
jgi:hypothetical protein